MVNAVQLPEEGIMESRRDRILSEYSESDFAGQLHMFLDHRDLRGHFVKIDRTELPQSLLVSKMDFQLRKPSRSIFRRLANAVNCLISLD